MMPNNLYKRGKNHRLLCNKLRISEMMFTSEALVMVIGFGVFIIQFPF